jgi:hypothetical protein
MRGTVSFQSPGQSSTTIAGPMVAIAMRDVGTGMRELYAA